MQRYPSTRVPTRGWPTHESLWVFESRYHVYLAGGDAFEQNYRILIFTRASPQVVLSYDRYAAVYPDLASVRRRIYEHAHAAISITNDVTNPCSAFLKRIQSGDIILASYPVAAFLGILTLPRQYLVFIRSARPAGSIAGRRVFRADGIHTVSLAPIAGIPPPAPGLNSGNSPFEEETKFGVDQFGHRYSEPMDPEGIAALAKSAKRRDTLALIAAIQSQAKAHGSLATPSVTEYDGSLSPPLSATSPGIAESGPGSPSLLPQSSPSVSTSTSSSKRSMAPRPPEFIDPPDKYRSALKELQLDKDFYFSHHYDLTTTLQDNILFSRTRALDLTSATISNATSERTSRPSEDLPSNPAIHLTNGDVWRFDKVFRSMFTWNSYIAMNFLMAFPSLDPIIKHVNQGQPPSIDESVPALRLELSPLRWLTCAVCGSFGRREIQFKSRRLALTLFSRRSRFAAGTRFIRRGITTTGDVANEVESELIMEEVGFKSQWTGTLCSFVITRGSIPLHWGQEKVYLPAPPIVLYSDRDPRLLHTEHYLRKCIFRYRGRIHILNLIKQHENRKASEVLLGGAFFRSYVAVCQRLAEQAGRLAALSKANAKSSPEEKSATLPEHTSIEAAAERLSMVLSLAQRSVTEACSGSATATNTPAATGIETLSKWLSELELSSDEDVLTALSIVTGSAYGPSKQLAYNAPVAQSTHQSHLQQEQQLRHHLLTHWTMSRASEYTKFELIADITSLILAHACEPIPLQDPLAGVPMLPSFAELWDRRNNQASTTAARISALKQYLGLLPDIAAHKSITSGASSSSEASRNILPIPHANVTGSTSISTPASGSPPQLPPRPATLRIPNTPVLLAPIGQLADTSAANPPPPPPPPGVVLPPGTGPVALAPRATGRSPSISSPLAPPPPPPPALNSLPTTNLFSTPAPTPGIPSLVGQTTSTRGQYEPMELPIPSARRAGNGTPITYTEYDFLNRRKRHNVIADLKVIVTPLANDVGLFTTKYGPVSATGEIEAATGKQVFASTPAAEEAAFAAAMARLDVLRQLETERLKRATLLHKREQCALQHWIRFVNHQNYAQRERMKEKERAKAAQNLGTSTASTSSSSSSRLGKIFGGLFSSTSSNAYSTMLSPTEAAEMTAATDEAFERFVSDLTNVLDSITVSDSEVSLPDDSTLAEAYSGIEVSLPVNFLAERTLLLHSPRRPAEQGLPEMGSSVSQDTAAAVRQARAVSSIASTLRVEHVVGSLQHGVVRVNCVDCLDRTNAAQFCVAKVALSNMLYLAGITRTRDEKLTPPFLTALQELFHEHGDRIAQQYAGSGAMHKETIFTDEDEGLVGSPGGEDDEDEAGEATPDQSGSSSNSSTSWFAGMAAKLGNVGTAVGRYYQNNVVDVDKQHAIQVFLGNYIPQAIGNRPNIWDMDPTSSFFLDADTKLEMLRAKAEASGSLKGFPVFGMCYPSGNLYALPINFYESSETDLKSMADQQARSASLAYQARPASLAGNPLAQSGLAVSQISLEVSQTSSTLPGLDLLAILSNPTSAPASSTSQSEDPDLFDAFSLGSTGHASSQTSQSQTAQSQGSGPIFDIFSLDASGK